MTAQDERACGDDVVLSTRNRLDIVIRRTRVEVASFAAKRDKPPDKNVDACTEIENAAREFPRGLIGTAYGEIFDAGCARCSNHWPAAGTKEAQLSRWTIGQLMENLLLANGAPFGPVITPS
jgi:hypothetical protein